MVELIWDGKYDEDSKRVAPLRVELPFQTVETVNESAQERQRNLFAYAAQQTEWRNRLIWGDKKYVLPSLLPEFAGKVDLIYIDPPFATGSDFAYKTRVGDENFTKKASVIEQKAYRDTWGKGLDGYMQWLYETAVILHELLEENGSLYIHLDYHVVHYAKGILDELFGGDNFQNEIIWKRTSAHSDAKQGSKSYGRQHDSILFYTKRQTWTWNQQYMPYDEEYVESSYRMIDDNGRRFQAVDLTAAKPGGDTSYEWKGYKLKSGRYWAYSKENMQKFEDDKRIYYTRNGLPRIKYYLDEMPGVPAQDLWIDIKLLGSQAHERVGYATQKPEKLLERIIATSSNENDLILDCFCGSGTTAAVAEKLGRRWITCDLGRFAIHTARKRLLAIDGVKPFIVQNLGKYERQVWQQAQFGENAAQVMWQYRRFILDLYDAEQIEGYTWIHGKKGGRLVHVGTVDSPVTEEDVRKIAIEFRKLIGTGKDAPKEAAVDILGWDFAFEINEVQKQLAKEGQIKIHFVRIPREVLEEKAVKQGDIQFYELAALSADVITKGRSVDIELTDFMVSPDDVPKNVIEAVQDWSEWIDYWAVDFNYRDDTFHNEWQSYRTRQDRSLELGVSHQYSEGGTYIVLVKVIDILGNDTTKAYEIEVG